MSKPEEGAEQPSVPAEQTTTEERQLLPTPESIAEELKAEAQEYKDKYLRALAEIENSRKRLSREKVEAQSYAVQNIVIDLLQPIDHLEQALKHAEEAKGDITTWAKGFEMILEQLHHVLADHGVSSYVSVNQPFDPHLHEAVETVERPDVLDGTVVFEFQKGYRLGGRTIRPARVQVATRPERNSKE
jgi:molecular chaperone GrpE